MIRSCNPYVLDRSAPDGGAAGRMPMCLLGVKKILWDDSGRMGGQKIGGYILFI